MKKSLKSILFASALSFTGFLSGCSDGKINDATYDFRGIIDGKEILFVRGYLPYFGSSTDNIYLTVQDGAVRTTYEDSNNDGKLDRIRISDGLFENNSYSDNSEAGRLALEKGQIQFDYWLNRIKEHKSSEVSSSLK